jgi:large subunit ribosomal protein L13
VKTYTIKKAEIKHEWHLIDASGQTLGRLSSQIARILQGKNKPTFSPTMDNGDFVVVINAEKVAYTGNKATKKFYYTHSQYPSGFKQVSLEEMLTKHPTRVIEHAVKGMLPHNRLGDEMANKLKVFAGEKHPYAAQFPKAKPAAAAETPTATETK